MLQNVFQERGIVFHGKKSGDSVGSETEGTVDSVFYLSGPPQMIVDCVAMLKELGVTDNQLNYELWW